MAAGLILAQIRALVPGLLSQGLSRRGMLRVLRGEGFAIRTQDFLGIVNEFQGFIKYESMYRRLKGSTSIPKFIMTEMRLAYPTAYRIFGNQILSNPVTGETWEKPVSFYSDTANTPEEIESNYYEEFGGADEYGGYDFVSFQVRNVQHNTGWSY